MKLAGQEIQSLPYIYGIDFSADRDEAGNKIWIAKEVVKGEKLQVLSGKCIARRRDWY
ncbi:MAG: hypothetical protein JRJ11_17055 [Deltaproteobacteria bacterium]|nr:hypothetical protein [Deltaproteobacteria bacterium]MBW1911218.1 hypothetical protein [Deltaproteobacteria bacterium]MBW2170155.1 hypothetical protein [Deltaproteobacteria bacterium]